MDTPAKRTDAWSRAPLTPSKPSPPSDYKEEDDGVRRRLRFDAAQDDGGDHRRPLALAPSRDNKEEDDGGDHHRTLPEPAAVDADDDDDQQSLLAGRPTSPRRWAWLLLGAVLSAAVAVVVIYVVFFRVFPRSIAKIVPPLSVQAFLDHHIASMMDAVRRKLSEHPTHRQHIQSIERKHIRVVSVDATFIYIDVIIVATQNTIRFEWNHVNNELRMQ